MPNRVEQKALRDVDGTFRKRRPRNEKCLQNPAKDTVVEMVDADRSRSGYAGYEGDCGIIPLRSGLSGEAEATAREHAARRDARLQPFGRAREKGVAHGPVTRSRPVVHLRERPVTG